MGWFEDFQSWGAGLLGGAEGAVSDVVSGAIDQGEGAIQAVQGAAGSISSDVTNYFISAAAPSPQVIEFPSEESVTQVAQYRPDIVITPETPAPAPTEGQDIFQQVVASAEGAVTAADKFLSTSFEASAAEPTIPPGPATQIIVTAPTPTPTPTPTTTTTTTSQETTTVIPSPTPVQTAENVGVLLGAGVLSAPASIFDILSNAGSTEVNAPVNLLKFALLGDYAFTGKVPAGMTEEEFKTDVLSGPQTSPESTYGADIRKYVVGAVSKGTGTQMTTTPLTTFMLPSDVNALKSENVEVRGTAVLNMTLTGLGDWILGNPVTAAVGPLQLLDVGGKIGTTGYVEKTTTGVGTLSSLVTTGKIPAKTTTPVVTAIPATPKQVKTVYKVTAISNKPECWGKLIGTAGCP